ncbi:MAG: hypothetical protein ACLQPN_17725, partial [Bryobacteraceae bacterium]
GAKQIILGFVSGSHTLIDASENISASECLSFSAASLAPGQQTGAEALRMRVGGTAQAVP